jgi:glutaredoxin
MKKILIVAMAAFLVIGILFFVGKGSVKEKLPQVDNEQTSKGKEVALFVSATCPHCQKVEEWLRANKGIEENSGMTIKEVNGNRENIGQLIKRGEECGFDERSKGAVPLLYDNGKCVLGDQPIIDYLSKKYK